MHYVLKMGRLYVSRPGSEWSYTRNHDEAQRFATREAAEACRCKDSETIVLVSSTHREERV